MTFSFPSRGLKSLATVVSVCVFVWLYISKTKMCSGQSKLTVKLNYRIRWARPNAGLHSCRKFYLHNSDIVCSVDLGVLCQLLTEGGYRTFQMFSLACVLFLNVCVYACRFSLQRKKTQFHEDTKKKLFVSGADPELLEGRGANP